MGGEINPAVAGVLKGRAQSAEFSETGLHFFQQIGFEELTISSENVNPTQNASAVKVEGTGTLKSIGHTKKGHVLTIRFGGTVTVKKSAELILNVTDMHAVAGDTLTLVCGDADWRELARTEATRAEELTAAETIAPSSTIVSAKVNGTTTIKKITATYNGHVVILRFSENVTVETGSTLRLAGNFAATANDTLTLFCNGTNWFEMARSANT